MTLYEYLAIPGNTLPDCLADFPDVVEAAELHSAVSFIDALKKTYGTAKILSPLHFPDYLETVAALTFDDYAEKIHNIRRMIAAFVEDRESETHSGTDVSTSTLDRKITNEEKAADDGAADFESAFSRGGSIQKETGAPEVKTVYGHVITRSGRGSSEDARIIAYQNRIHGLFADALAEFGVLFESAVV